MSLPAILLGIALAAVAVSLLLLLRRPAAAANPQLPEQWAQRLHALLPICAALPAPLLRRHLQQAEIFLRDKRFIGCNGLDISDEMRLITAGYACLLILREDATVFPAVRSVLIYPGAFLVPHDEPDELGLVSDEPVEQIGESWQGDRVLLSWEDVQAAVDGGEDNVVVHEFAHQLDDEDSATTGAPQLRNYERWSEVMHSEYERLRRHRRPPVLDPYGGESPAEFFGVVTEAFIQRGTELSRHHPQLYALLRDYYGFETNL